MRTQLAAGLLAVASISQILASPATPFYQQGQENKELLSLTSNNAKLFWTDSAALLEQTPFSGGSELSNEVFDEHNDSDDEEEEEDEDEDEVEQHELQGEEAMKHRHRKGWVYLIRHGEKVKKSDKTGLSDRGIQRAKCLIEVFGSHDSRSTYPIDYILAQDFKSTGQRRRPFETVKPLAKKHHLPLDHSCDRDDTSCASRKIKRKTRKGENVLVVWEHARLSNIAKSLGVKGLVYPSDRYDIVFKIKGKKVHSIFSEECQGLDGDWFDWQAERKGRHGKSPYRGRLIDDESWAE